MFGESRAAWIVVAGGMAAVSCREVRNIAVEMAHYYLGTFHSAQFEW